MMARKVSKMHQLFGIEYGKKCKDCRHLKGGVNNYRKCKIYGDSASEATDWALSWDACGLWNKDYEGDVEIYKLNRGVRPPETQIKGQMSLFGGEA